MAVCISKFLGKGFVLLNNIILILNVFTQTYFFGSFKRNLFRINALHLNMLIINNINECLFYML